MEYNTIQYSTLSNVDSSSNVGTKRTQKGQKKGKYDLIFCVVGDLRRGGRGKKIIKYDNRMVEVRFAKISVHDLGIPRMGPMIQHNSKQQ